MVLGGPLYQIWRRTRLAGDGLRLLRRRVVALTALAWVPLLVFSIAQGHAWGGGDCRSWGRGIARQILLAMQLLILAELVVHTRMRPVINSSSTQADIGLDTR